MEDGNVLVVGTATWAAAFGWYWRMRLWRVGYLSYYSLITRIIVSR